LKGIRVSDIQINNCIFADQRSDTFWTDLIHICEIWSCQNKNGKRFSPNTSVVPYHYHSTQCSVLIFIYTFFLPKRKKAKPRNRNLRKAMFFQKWRGCIE